MRRPCVSLVPCVAVPIFLAAGSEVGSDYTNAIDGSTMVVVPGGPAVIGSSKGEENERPVHTVTVPAFAISKHEVTNRQWAKFLEANPQWQRDRIRPDQHNGAYLKHWAGASYPTDKAEHPVMFVSWFAARAYCEWAGGRLPTEAEWEKACRAGSTAEYCFGDDEEQLNEYAWSRGNADGSTRPVGGRKANQLGLHDMHGNVWEWTSSMRKPYPYRSDDGREDLSDTKSPRVIRGGSWHVLTRSVFRSATRCYYPPKGCDFSVGFRVCVSVKGVK